MGGPKDLGFKFARDISDVNSFVLYYSTLYASEEGTREERSGLLE